MSAQPLGVRKLPIHQTNLLDRALVIQHLPSSPLVKITQAARLTRHALIKANATSGRADVVSFPALKEWAPAVSALLNGDQTILLRKGGIREPTFTPKSQQFLLFPTAFHTDESLLKPELQSQYNADCQKDPKTQSALDFYCLAEVTGAWATTDPDVLAALTALHIYGPNFLDARLRWRPTQPITVLELRAYRLVLQFI